MLRLPLIALVLAIALVPSAGASTPPQTAPLTISITGTGAVRVSGRPPIACKATCSKILRVRVGAIITLTALPAAGWKQSPWSGACNVNRATCKVHVTHGTRAAVTFIAPGAKTNPIPLGTPALIRNNWKLTVTAATLVDDAEVLAIKDDFGYPANPPLPPNAHYSVVSISLTYLGGGSDFPPDLHGEGAQNASYGTYSCIAPAPTIPDSQVFSGTTITGNICMKIAAIDVGDLMLTADGPNYNQVWFDLR